MVDQAAAIIRGVGDAHAERLQPVAVGGARADDATGDGAGEFERPIVGGRDHRDLVHVRPETRDARGEQVDVDVGGGQHHRTDPRHRRLAGLGAQHPEGFQRQQRPHRVGDDIDLARALRRGERLQEVLEGVA